MSNPTSNTPDKDIHAALTELVLELKKDGTVGILASKIGIPRNRLTTIFRAYDGLLVGKAPPRSKKDPSRTSLCWEIEPLCKIKDALGMRLSDLIRAAEDVQDGLPPWFRARISENTQPQTRAELVHVFLEAAGCRTYAMKDPLGVKGTRKSFKHYNKSSLSEDAASTLGHFVNFILGNGQLNCFVEAYEDGKITSVEAYQELKKVIDAVIGNVHGVEDEAGVLALINRLGNTRGELTDRISSQVHRFLEKKKSEQTLDKGKKSR